MFSFFKRMGKNTELEELIRKLQSNCENNYKDAAQENLKKLEERYAAMCETQALSEKQIRYYDEVLAGYRERMQKFTHKDQTPYWK
ncbi:MAG: hypothetical protein IKY53_00120 [Lachnospiraceae bacterium]|nr:hypothetical protein [Lachnospiraceae bacterium]